MKVQQISKAAFKVGQVGLVAIFALTMIAALHPEARTSVRDKVMTDYRTVISSVQADLTGDGSTFTVAKIQTRDAVLLEVYRHEADGSMRVTEKIEIKDSKDGYFSFNGQATNLAIEDIDGDGKPEILAPSFDRDLVGHLNVFRLSENMQGLDRVIR